MKKRILAILITAALAVSVTGCAGNATNDDESSLATTATESSASNSATEESDASSAEESSDNGAEESKDNSSQEESKDLEANYTKYTLDGDLTQHMIDMSRLNEGNKVRLANVIKKLKNGEEVTVGFIGGSITQGTSAGNELCYAKLTADWLQQTYSSAKVNYVNAGIGATGSYIGVHRVTTDLLSKNPDLVFVEFSVNDTTEFTERNKDSYDSLLRTIWKSSTNPAIITIATTQEDGTSFQEQHAEIVKHYDLPMISYRNTILDTIKHGDIVWKDISDDNIHPNVPGHKIVSQLLQAYISDVDKDVDNIGGNESDFSTPATNASFENGSLLTLAQAGDAVAMNGEFKTNEANFGGFDGYWFFKGSNKTDLSSTDLTFKVNAKEIGILYGKYTKSGCSADVYIDDELAITLNADFTGGWGNYVECAQIKSFDTAGEHTVKIVPKTTDGPSIFSVTALAIA